MHEENGACTRGEILSRFSPSYMTMATNADQGKWRQMRISAVPLNPRTNAGPKTIFSPPKQTLIAVMAVDVVDFPLSAVKLMDKGDSRRLNWIAQHICNDMHRLVVTWWNWRSRFGGLPVAWSGSFRLSLAWNRGHWRILRTCGTTKSKQEEC